MKEIVGAMVGTIITNNFANIRDAYLSGRQVQLLDRKHMQLMAACDLGQNWEKMAAGPTLFVIDDDGNPRAPNAGIQPPPVGGRLE